MRLIKLNILITTLTIGLLSACGSQPTKTPTSTMTKEIVPATATSTNTPLATNTITPTNTATPTETLQPTEESTAELSTTTTGVSFANDVFPILQGWCIKCHGDDRVEEGLSMKTYADLMSGSDNGVDVVPSDAENSLLAKLILTQKMPKRGPKLSQTQIQIIVDWINQGALDN